VKEGEIPFQKVDWGRTKILAGAENFMVKITEYGKGIAHEYHRHPDQEEIIFVLDGNGMSEIDGVKREIGPQMVVYIPKNMPHATYNLSKDRPMQAIIIKSPPGPADD
jgi:quercetin dioxygenase-like cupin family protein